MILLAHALARLVGFLALLALALAGIAAAVFCIATGTSGPSLGNLASILHLAALRDTIGGWLSQIEASGSVAVIAAAGGLGAVLLGLLLLAGVLVPRRERLVQLTSNGTGTVAARRRPLAQVARALAEQARGVTEAKVKVRPRRSSGGRLRVRASRPEDVDAGAVRSAVDDQLRVLTEPFGLSARVEVRRDHQRVH